MAATVLAYAAGKVTLGKVPTKTKVAALRYAPSFIVGQMINGSVDHSHPYTSEQLAQFLGIGQPRVAAALRGLELVERK